MDATPAVGAGDVTPAHRAPPVTRRRIRSKRRDQQAEGLQEPMRHRSSPVFGGGIRMGWDPKRIRRSAGTLRRPVWLLLLAGAAFVARGEGDASRSATIELQLPADIVFSRTAGS